MPTASSCPVGGVHKPMDREGLAVVQEAWQDLGCRPPVCVAIQTAG